jgi:hypothetical protein
MTEDRVGPTFGASVALRPNERVLKSSTIGRGRLFRAIIGTLYLTNERLIFCPHAYSLSWSPVVIENTDIGELGDARVPSFRNLAHLFVSIAWYVKASDRTHFFTSLTGETDKEAWLRAISSLTDVPIGETRAR